MAAAAVVVVVLVGPGSSVSQGYMPVKCVLNLILRDIKFFSKGSVNDSVFSSFQSKKKKIRY